MGVIRDREKETVSITQEKYTKSLLEQYGMASCNSTYAPDVGNELWLDQPEERFPSTEEKTTFLGRHGQCNVPWTDDSLWHLIHRQPTGKGDV